MLKENLEIDQEGIFMLKYDDQAINSPACMETLEFDLFYNPKLVFTFIKKKYD
jgi:hypothetical protein